MFTGIVEAQGEVLALDRDEGGARLRVTLPDALDGLRVGGSLAVDGVCLTLTAVEDREAAMELSAETLRRTTLGELRPGREVNLEPPLRPDSPLGGHFVQGHVDGVGVVARLLPEGDGRWMEITLDDGLLRYVAEKGSVALDGVSLTVAALRRHGFAVALIPHTLAVTTLGRREPGDRVNIEVDVLAKYAARLLGQDGSHGEES